VNVDWAALGAVIAAISALGGLFVVIEQMTTAARLRREATFWRECREAATREDDIAVLDRLFRAATARVIGIQLIPARKLLMPTYVLLLGLGVAFAGAGALFVIPEQPVNFWEGLPFAALGILGLYLLFKALTGISVILLGRRHVARQYLHDVEGELPSFPEGNERLFASKPLWLSFVSFSAGMWAAAVGAGFAAADEPDGTWPAFLAFYAALILLLFGIPAIKSLLEKDRIHLFHPHPGLAGGPGVTSQASAAKPAKAFPDTKQDRG
jgi:hypothetical protein